PLPPRPPTFTLFPYTTLFRSHLPAARPVAHGLVQPLEQSTVAAPHVDDVLRLRCVVVPVEASNDQIAQRGEVLLMLESAADDVEDRKSTRLNSSHQIISYAVF